MAEYIEKDELIKEGWHLERTKSGDGFINIEHREIKDIPAADVRPVKRGKWEKDSDGLSVCSECGEVALQRVFIKVPDTIVDLQMVESKFCPNCGADMREVTDET